MASLAIESQLSQLFLSEVCEFCVRGESCLSLLSFELDKTKLSLVRDSSNGAKIVERNFRL